MNWNELSEFVETSQEDAILQSHSQDWAVNFKGQTPCVAFPSSNEDIEKILHWANKHHCAIVPSGGRTGLSSAATATQGELVVSFDKMNKILEFNEWDLSLRVQAGVITENVHNFALEKGFFFPVDFAAKGSSQIGGNVNTNAGGLRVVRYGGMRDWVSGLTLYTGNGQRLDLNRGLVKNNTGYDLKNLIIGSEGTLGLVTEVELKLTTPPGEQTVLVLALEDLSNALAVFHEFRQSVKISACEFFSDLALNKVLDSHDVQAPFESKPPFYLLLEVQGNSESLSEPLFELFEKCMENNWIHDGIISQSPQQAIELWKLRELISESLSPFTPYKNDVSVRVSQVAKFSKDLQNAFEREYQGFEVVLFGHIGDGNVHVNILKPQDMDRDTFLKKCHSADIILFELIQHYGGAVSAEHGVGLVKRDFLKYCRSPQEISIMRSIKSTFDPHGILNPGKIFHIK